MTWALNPEPTLSVPLMLCLIFAIFAISTLLPSTRTQPQIFFSSNASRLGLHPGNIVLHSFPEFRNARLHVSISVVHVTGRLTSRGMWGTFGNTKQTPLPTALLILHQPWKDSPPPPPCERHCGRETLDSQTALQGLVLLQSNARNAASCTGTSQHRPFGV